LNYTRNLEIQKVRKALWRKKAEADSEQSTDLPTLEEGRDGVKAPTAPILANNTSEENFMLNSCCSV
jgi:hypothetical protein